MGHDATHLPAVCPGCWNLNLNLNLNSSSEEVALFDKCLQMETEGHGSSHEATEVTSCLVGEEEEKKTH